MKKKSRTLSIVACLLIVGLVLGYSAWGAVRAGEPTVVVTVNLSKVMEKLDQRADAEARLKKVRDDLRAEQEKRAKEIEKFKDDAKAMQDQLDNAKDPKQKADIEARMQNLTEEATHATLKNQAWVAFSSDRVDIEASLVMQDLYRSVKTAVAQMASTNRYDLVLVDDSQGELTTNGDARIPRVQQIQQQVAARRMLYVNPVIDITDDLINRMNNDYRAHGPKPTQ